MLVALLIFLLACAILGYRIISSVPSLFHTPLMSGMNALSDITVLGAISVFATIVFGIVLFLSGPALFMAMINVVGGFWVTDRMLKMFNTSGRRKGE